MLYTILKKSLNQPKGGTVGGIFRNHKMPQELSTIESLSQFFEFLVNLFLLMFSREKLWLTFHRIKLPENYQLFAI